MGNDNRERALDSEYAIRRIFPRPDCWRKPPESRMTSQAFADRKGEPSVDLYDSLTPDECNRIKNDNAQAIEEGFGLANAQVSSIRQMLVDQKFEGDVLRDPVEENPKHGVISGELTDKKKKALSKLFDVCVVPDPDKYADLLKSKKNQS